MKTVPLGKIVAASFAAGLLHATLPAAEPEATASATMTATGGGGGTIGAQFSPDGATVVTSDGKTWSTGHRVGTNGGQFQDRLQAIIGKPDGAAPQETSWLGVGAEEAPEILSSQLGLDPGVGLVVSYVAPGSPAEKAGLEKNDLLVEFQGQPLVHPMQLRKLVRVRKEGDAIKLAFYRAGKKRTVSATLGKSTIAAASSPFPARASAMTGESLRKMQEEINRSMEEARRAYEQAMHGNTNGTKADAFHAVVQQFQARSADAGQNGSTLVRSTGNGVQSLVQTDDKGTIVVFSQSPDIFVHPQLHLTAHDKEGKMIFEGEVGTPDQRAKVPADLWQRAEPLVHRLEAPGKPKLSTPPRDTSSLRKGEVI